jgi:hypothetical protein
LNNGFVKPELFTCGGLGATAGFLLSADKRNKNSWRPFYWFDFLNKDLLKQIYLTATGCPPLYLICGLLYCMTFAALIGITLGRLRLENLRK